MHSLFSAQPQISSSGTLTYTPALNANGTATVTVTAKDSGGTANGGVDASVAQNFTITVTAVDDNPVAVNDSKTVAEDDAATTIDVLSNAANVDGGTKSVQSVTQPGLRDRDYHEQRRRPHLQAERRLLQRRLAHGRLQLHPQRRVDCQGHRDRNLRERRPGSKNDSGATDEDTALNNINVLGNDTNVENDDLSISSFDATSLEGGSVTKNADGTFNYTPKNDFFGTDSFTYKAKDASLDSNSAKVTISIRAINDAPAAKDNTYTTDEDTPLTVAAPGLLGNDTDVENDTLRVADANATTADGISPISGPANGTVTLNADGSYTYTPNNNFFGSDSYHLQGQRRHRRLQRRHSQHHRQPGQ